MFQSIAHFVSIVMSCATSSGAVSIENPIILGGIYNGFIWPANLCNQFKNEMFVPNLKKYVSSISTTLTWLHYII